MQPFDDVDVLDLTQSVAGPVCTQMLAALGANVVKVEPPEGDAFRSLADGTMFAAYNRGPKQSLSVDLKTGAGAALVRDLAGTCDVVVESFRPGVLSKFDLDYESVAETNEDVVYCSVTGFGQDGPYRDRPAYDPVLQAMSGLMSVTGYPDRPPVRIGASVIDCSTGANAAFMVVSALRERDRRGVGQHIDISLYDVAVSWMSYWLGSYDLTGEEPARAGTGFSGIAPNQLFSTGDGELLYICGINQRIYERLCTAVDREDLLTDERFETNADRWAHRDALREELETTFADVDRDALVSLLVDHGVPAGPQLRLSEVLADEHARERGLLAPAEDVFVDEEVTVSRLPLRTAEGPLDTARQPPRPGEHTRAVLRASGYDDDEIERLLADEVVFEHG